MSVSRVAQPTGIAGLDVLLEGGLLRGSLLFVVGPSGAGKTILAAQLAFHTVECGQSCLFLTTLSQGQVKLLDHLRPLAFFDEDAIGTTLTLHPLSAIVGNDLEQGAIALAKLIRERGAQLVIIDGMQLVMDDARYRAVAPQFFATLATQLSYLQSTVIITLTGDARTAEIARILTAADSVLALDFDTVGWLHQRRIEVIKHRGGPHLSGCHSYHLSGSGMTIFPRLEVQTFPAETPGTPERYPFGLAELDHLLRGGLPASSISLLLGAPGAGKTTLALHWGLAGATREEQTLFVSFEEHVTQLRRKAQAFGLPLDAALTDGTLQVLYHAPVALDPDAFATDLLARLTAPIRRVVLDNCAPLLLSLGSRAPTYLAALRDQLYLRGITTLLLADMHTISGWQIDARLEPLATLSDNLLLIQQVVAQGALHRILAVLKMRHSAFDATLREVVLDEQGVRILTASESATDVLNDLARSTGLIVPVEQPARTQSADDPDRAHH